MSNHPSTCGEKKIEEVNIEILFSSNNFGLWAEKTWTFIKTVKHDFQNCSLRVQGNNFRYFLKQDYLNESFRSLNGNIGFPAGIFSSELQKAHFRCPVQHFEINMIKVNFTFCGLLRTLCVFFCSSRKINQGFQNHKLSVQRKNLGRIFLTQMLFQNILLILSGKTWSFSGKLPAWLQI